MIVTIDGPAGAGKSTVARALARRLGIRFLDTGAMYRAVTLAAVRRGVDLADEDQLAALARRINLDVREDAVLVDGEDVTGALRGHEITRLVRHAAGNPRVREHLVQLQRRLGRDTDLVTEGRDQGTVVFPHAEHKMFLTASPEQRARRRMQDLAARGENVSFDDVLADQNARDQRDTTRTCGPLVAAPDAIELNTDELTQQQVVDRLIALIGRSAE